MTTTTVLRPYRKQSWEFNRCGLCGQFRPWGELTLHFVPDSCFSSEDESYRECKRCRRQRRHEEGKGQR